MLAWIAREPTKPGVGTELEVELATVGSFENSEKAVDCSVLRERGCARSDDASRSASTRISRELTKIVGGDGMDGGAVGGKEGTARKRQTTTCFQRVNCSSDCANSAAYSMYTTLTLNSHYRKYRFYQNQHHHPHHAVHRHGIQQPNCFYCQY